MEVDLKNRKVQNNKNGKRNKVHNNKTDITSNLVSHKLEEMETISENNVKSDMSSSQDKKDEILYDSNKVSLISRLQARHPIPLTTPDPPLPRVIVINILDLGYFSLVHKCLLINI